MEHRQDYLESQMDIISKMLRRLLEKLMKLEPEEMQHEMESIIAGPEIAQSGALTIDKLKDIEDTALVRTLVNEYSYTVDNIKELADILYLLLRKGNNQTLTSKTLTLYRHYLAGTTKSVDFLVFSRVNELANK